MTQYRQLFVASFAVLFVSSLVFLFTNNSSGNPTSQDATEASEYSPNDTPASASGLRRITRYVPVTEYVPANDPQPSHSAHASSQNSSSGRYSISSGEETILLNEQTGESWLLRDSSWHPIHRPGHFGPDMMEGGDSFPSEAGEDVLDGSEFLPPISIDESGLIPEGFEPGLNVYPGTEEGYQDPNKE